MRGEIEEMTELVEGRGPRPGSGSYRVEYLTAEGGGHIVIAAGDWGVSIVDRAAALLRREGIDDARVRRIVPLSRR